MNDALTVEILYAGAAFLAMTVALALFVKKERRHLARLGLIFGFSLAFRLVSTLLAGAGMPSSGKTFGFLALLLQGVAFLGVAAVVVFVVLLRAFRIDAPRILRDLTVAAAYIVFVFYLFSTHHVDVTGIVATSAVVTAVIGFSLQDTLANVMGGVALQLDGSVEPGDWVKYGDVRGQIREITWRHTAIQTRNGDTLVVPNNLLMKNPLLNEGRRLDDPVVKQRRWVYFNVDYRTPPTTVIDSVTQALCREPIPNVAATPAPSVVLMDFKESWGSYAARYWLTDPVLDDPTDSLVRTRVYFALRRAGVPLSIPAQSVFVTAEDRERQEHLREKEHRARLEALEGVSILKTLTGDERELLAQGLFFAPFAAGEAMVAQGSTVHHLYILAKGKAEVRVAVEGAPPRVVAALAAPDFFGEMGLLTGEKRKATVVALTPAECWRLEKERFQQVLKARPQIADEISHILAARDVELVAVREGLSEEAKRLRLRHEHDSLLERIQHFFGIA